MDGKTSGTHEAIDDQASVDPWLTAFTALEPKSEEASEADTEGQQDDGGDNNTSAENASGDGSIEHEAGHGEEDAPDTGGLGTAAGSYGDEDTGSEENLFVGIDVSGDSIAQYETDLTERIRNQAINDIAQEFIKRDYRNNNGVLGATIDDPDICKRDEDGVPHFYNPDTGREFTENPRSQAQAWVDAYNKDLARVFNNACSEYEKHLMGQASPQLAVMKFAPKYKELDDIRRGMLDNVIQDYEIKDEGGKVVGYNCDLDKALALVDRQISMIQNYAKQQSSASQQQTAQQATGPALDMKTSNGAVATGDKPVPQSLAEAMERQQDALLESLKK